VGHIRCIGITASVVIAGVLILISNHWVIIAPQPGGLGIVRLNRWTGSIDICAIDGNTIKGGSVNGAQLTCKYE
jgi:hypothetical protein